MLKGGKQSDPSLGQLLIKSMNKWSQGEVIISTDHLKAIWP